MDQGADEVRPGRRWARETLVAGVVAGVVSGLPSTVCALAAGRDPAEATLAAGRMLLPGERRPVVLLAAAVPVHGAISLGWAGVLAAVLPRRPGLGTGALAGLVIAGLDLGIVGRWAPYIRALPQGPQVADHVAFGVLVAWTLRRLRKPSYPPGTSLG